MTSPTDQPIRANPTDDARITHLYDHIPTGFRIVRIGFGYRRYDGYILFALVNETPNLEQPTYWLYIFGVDGCHRYAYVDNNRVTSGGLVVLESRSTVYHDELHVGPLENPSMRLVTRRDDIRIESVDPLHVTPIFGQETMALVPKVVRMAPRTLKLILDSADNFVRFGGPKADFVWLNEQLDDADDQSVTVSGDACEVPVLCLDLMRRLLSRSDQPREGRYLWSDVSYGNVVEPLTRLAMYMRKYLDEYPDLPES